MRLQISPAKRIRSVLVFLCVCSLGYAGMVWSQEGHSAQYRQGYAQGRAEADAQFASGIANAYTMGLPVDIFVNVDGESGLPFKAIAGCLVDDSIMGRFQGHHDRVLELIKAGKTPTNSYKTWIDDLNDLVRYHAKQIKLQQPVRLSAGGPSVDSPDGKYKVRCDVPKGSQTPSLFVTGPNGKEAVVNLIAKSRDREMVWGPKGAPFCVVRYSFKDGTESYQSYDLNTGNNIYPTTRVKDDKQKSLMWFIGPDEL